MERKKNYFSNGPSSFHSIVVTMLDERNEFVIHSSGDKEKNIKDKKHDTTKISSLSLNRFSFERVLAFTD